MPYGVNDKSTSGPTLGSLVVYVAPAFELFIAGGEVGDDSEEDEAADGAYSLRGNASWFSIQGRHAS